MRYLIGGLAGLALGAGGTAAAFLAPETARPQPPASQSVSPPRGAISQPTATPQSFSAIIKKVSPAVVSVHVISTADDPRIGPAVPGRGVPVMLGLGSGFLISPDGYVVTNNHVVSGSQAILVTTGDEREFDAKIVGVDEATDLAVLKIEGRNFPYVSFENTAKPEVGDWVLAVGSPFGLGGTATAGIVSAYARDIGEAYVDYIQTDAAINRGNSGGPMFDLRGHVIGVNTAIFSPSQEGGSVGIGFAIPADLADRVVGELIQRGRVTRGYIGASLAPLTPALARQLGISGQQEGALIAGVVARGPAMAAGLRPGDLVVAIDGEPIPSETALVRKVGEARAGERHQFDVVREGRRLRVNVVTGDR